MLSFGCASYRCLSYYIQTYVSPIKKDNAFTVTVSRRKRYMTSDTDEERDRGILTQKDRGYLAGTLEPDNRQQEYRREKNIPKRVENATKDLRILAAHLDDEKVEEIFNREVKTVETDDGFTSEVEGEIYPKHMTAAYSFFSFASIKNHLHDDTSGGKYLDPETLQFLGVQDLIQPALEDFERGLEDMLYRRFGLISDLEVSVTTNRLNTEEGYGDAVKERLEDTDEPPRGEERIKITQRLLASGHSPDEIATILGEGEETADEETKTEPDTSEDE
jgi:hypothetical protein